MRPQIFLQSEKKSWISLRVFVLFYLKLTLSSISYVPRFPFQSSIKPQFLQATSIFPSAIFKVPPKFPHFLNLIAKYSILGAQCYSAVNLIHDAWNSAWLDESIRDFSSFIPHKKSGIPIVLATSLIVQASLDVKSLIFTIFYIKICWHFCWDLKSSY